MTVRPGQYSLFTNPAQTLGSAQGRTYPLQNSEWAVLPVVRVVVVTTATAGTRAIVLRVLGAAPASPILFDVLSQVVLTAGQTWFVNYGSGFGLVTSGNFTFAPIPTEMPIPQFAQIQLFDNSNVDVADTIQVNASFAM